MDWIMMVKVTQKSQMDKCFLSLTDETLATSVTITI